MRPRDRESSTTMLVLSLNPLLLIPILKCFNTLLSAFANVLPLPSYRSINPRRPTLSALMDLPRMILITVSLKVVSVSNACILISSHTGFNTLLSPPATSNLLVRERIAAPEFLIRLIMESLNTLLLIISVTKSPPMNTHRAVIPASVAALQ